MDLQTLPVSDLKCKLLVLKVASRCNLNCTYCYMYNLGDTTYMKQPKVMSDDVVDSLIARVKKHCHMHGIDVFDFNFHGGEPLLAGPAFFEKFVSKANEALLPEITPIFSMQTNGTLLTPQWCTVLGKLDIHIGISLDGTPESNDMHRIDHAGKGSYKQIINGIRIAQESEDLPNRPGLLSVINIKSDPAAVFEHFKSINPNNIDFLLPDANYESLPYESANELQGNWETPYADWLIGVFDPWFNEKKIFGITIFESFIRIILGNTAGSEVVGDANKEQLVIETDGGIEPVGQLKICGNGFTKLGMNVLQNDIDDIIHTDLGILYHLSGKKICRFCQECPIREICGAGYLPHRYSRSKGFNNPSIYCHDLVKLITHIQNRLLDVIPAHLQEELGIVRISYDEVRKTLQDNAAYLEEEDHQLEYFRENIS